MKWISFITPLDERKYVMFREYKGPTPISWKDEKDPQIYSLKAENKDRVGIIILEQ